MKKIWTVLLVIMGVMMFVESDFAPFMLQPVFAHCDTLDGPVVKTARIALEKGDVTPILKWVKKDDEKEIRDLFRKTLFVRNKGKEARELADMYFFETLVRLHRAGEEEPYTGLKPAGAVDPAIVEADKALESGSVERLEKLITGQISAGIRKRFNKAEEAKKHADHSIEAGREFVKAYVQFTHYVERLNLDSASHAERHGAAPGTIETAPHHKH